MNSGRGDQYYNNKNRNGIYDKSRSYDRSISYDMNNRNFRGRNTFRDDRNRCKYNKGNRRNFKDRDRSYDMYRNRGRDNRLRSSMNRGDSGSRNRGRLPSRDKSEERW